MAGLGPWRAHSSSVAKSFCHFINRTHIDGLDDTATPHHVIGHETKSNNSAVGSSVLVPLAPIASMTHATLLCRHTKPVLKPGLFWQNLTVQPTFAKEASGIALDLRLQAAGCSSSSLWQQWKQRAGQPSHETAASLETHHHRDRHLPVGSQREMKRSLHSQPSYVCLELASPTSFLLPRPVSSVSDVLTATELLLSGCEPLLHSCAECHPPSR